MFMVSCLSVASIMTISMPLALVGSALPLFLAYRTAAPSGSDGVSRLADVPWASYDIGGGSLRPWHSGLSQPVGALSVHEGEREGGELQVVLWSTILVAAGAAAGVPCSLSMATEYMEVDGFLNGLISMLAGIGATTFPLVVPLLAKALPSLGFQVGETRDLLLLRRISLCPAVLQKVISTA